MGQRATEVFTQAGADFACERTRLFQLAIKRRLAVRQTE